MGKLSRPLNHGPTSALSKNKKEDGNTDSALQVLPIREKELNKATDAASLSSSISVPTDKLATSSETAQKDVQGKPRTATLPERDFDVIKDPFKPKEAPLLKKDEPKNSFPNNVDKQIAKTPIDPSTKHTQMKNDKGETPPIMGVTAKEHQDVKKKQEEKS